MNSLPSVFIPSHNKIRLRFRLLLFSIIYGLLLLHFGCQKEYYLEDLKAAEQSYTLLKNTLDQINRDNHNLISSNQQLEIELSNLFSELEKLYERNERIGVSNLLDRINIFEEKILSLELEREKEIDEYRIKTETILKDIVTNFNTETELILKIERFLTVLNQDNSKLEDLIDTYDTLRDDYAVLLGVQDGYYKLIKASYQVSSEDYENQNFTLETRKRRHHYYEIKNNNILYQGRVKKNNDPNYYDNDYSTIPFSDKFFLLGSDFELKVLGFNKVRIKYSLYGNYEIREIEKIDSIPYNRTNDEYQDFFKEKNTGFFSDPLYQKVDFNDLNSFLEVFIQDAERYGKDISWINPSNFRLELSNSLGYRIIHAYNASFTCHDGKEVASSGTFLINKDWWNFTPFVDRRNLHIQILWRFFSHWILGYSYTENEDISWIMSNYLYRVEIMTYDHDNRKLNFKKSVESLFKDYNQYRNSCNY